MDPRTPLIPPHVTRNDVTLIDLPPGLPLHRVHDSLRGPIEFNPSVAGNARFSPLLDLATGAVVPTLYAGTTLDCALMETVFHDVPYAPGMKVVSKRTHLTGRVVSQLEVNAALTLIDLSAIALHKLGIPRQQLLDNEKDQYPTSREWARHLYAQFPAAQGLLWTSRQDDRAQACILFGTRIDGGALRPESVPEPLLNPDGSARIEVLSLARRLNVLIVD